MIRTMALPIVLSNVANSVRTVQKSLWGTSSQAVLPEHVRTSVKRSQENSEIVIGWVQLAIVLTFGALYALAPKTFVPGQTVAPVPIVLTAYVAFTALRIVLAHLRRLPYWVLCLSVVLDVALLMGLIWSFHVQYQQPASFYLKVPTFLYLFIFIVLRALRFEAGFVVLAGLIGALGWLAMVGYATHIDPNDPMITKDYVEYMTSNSVLLGAEFDKVISVLIVTFILVLSLTRAQRLLVQATLEGTRARELSRFVPQEVAEDVVAHAEPIQTGAGEERLATILFIDLEGFTSVSEGLSPGELVTTLNDYFATVAKPLEQRGGVITQFQGDAILASFNVPKPNSEHAREAIEAAIEMQALIHARPFGNGIQLRARVGINTGWVVGGLVGTPDRVAYTVHGDAVNLAARLEGLNKRFGSRILVSDATRQAAGVSRFEFISRGRAQVRGKQGDTAVFEIPLPTSN